jgi:hypothetical protein
MAGEAVGGGEDGEEEFRAVEGEESVGGLGVRSGVGGWSWWMMRLRLRMREAACDASRAEQSRAEATLSGSELFWGRYLALLGTYRSAARLPEVTHSESKGTYLWSTTKRSQYYQKRIGRNIIDIILTDEYIDSFAYLREVLNFMLRWKKIEKIFLIFFKY